MKDEIDRGFDDIMDAIKNPKVKCYTTIILDRSGSMCGNRQESIDEFNNQLAIAKEQTELDMCMSLVTFSYDVDNAQYWLEPVSSIEPMVLDDYQPDGNTSLLDAIGFTLTKLRIETEPSSKHLVFIISDGQENASREYNGASIKKLLTEFNEDKRWTITYFGCNIDAMTLERDYGILRGNHQVFSGMTGPIGAHGNAGTAGRSANSRLYYNTVSSGATVDSFYGNATGGATNGQS